MKVLKRTFGLGVNERLQIRSGVASVSTPANLLASVVSDSVILLSWSAVSGVDGYKIYKSTDNITFTLHGTNATTSYNAGTLNENTKYYFKVTAYKGGSESQPAIVSEYTNPVELSSAWGVYDFTSASNLVKDGSNRISQVTDLSGNGNHLLQSDDAKKPIYSDGYVISDGVDDFMKTGSKILNIPVTVYTLIDVPSDGFANKMIFDGNSNYSMYCDLQGTSANPSVRIFKGISLPPAPSNIFYTDKKTLLTAVYNGVNSVNQVSKKSAITGDIGSNYGNPSGVTIMSVGDGTSNSKAKWYFQLIFNTAHDEQTRTKIQNYLYRKHAEIIELWVLAGQSNSLGKDSVSNITGSDYKTAISNAYIFNNVASKFVQYNPGVTSQTDIGSFGAENSFLKKISDYKSKKIYMLKFGVSAASLADNPGYIDWCPTNVGEAWDNFKYNLSNQTEDSKKYVVSFRFKGLIWIQGETDSDNNIWASAYETNLPNFIDNYMIPELNSKNNIYGHDNEITKVIVGCTNFGPFYQIIRSAQQGYCQASGAIYIDTSSMSYRPGDGAHYNADSLIAIGEDVFEAVKDL